MRSAVYIGRSVGDLKQHTKVALLFFKSTVALNVKEYEVTAVKAKNLTRFFGSRLPTVEHPGTCFVSELADHGSLREFLLKNGPGISMTHKLIIAEQVGRGLGQLHCHHLVHADVAARNVLVYKFDRNDHLLTKVKLSDYGLVRAKSEYTHHAAEAEEQGATRQPLSLAPKWAAWESLKKDVFYRASDIWSFGVLIWEVLTEGDKPYPGIDSGVPAMIAHLENGNNRLSRPKKGCDDDDLWCLVEKCWRESYQERPSLDTLLTQLEKSRISHIEAEVTRPLKNELDAIEAGKAAWTLPGFGWSSGDIVLSKGVDDDLDYKVHDDVPLADLLSAPTDSAAMKLADAIENLATEKGGRQGNRFRVIVETVTLAKKQSLINAFNERMKKMLTQRLANAGTEKFNGRWDANLSEAELQEKRAIYQRLTPCFTETEFHHQSASSQVNVALMWHGVPSESIADAILATGLSSRVSDKDEGYFGKGVYLTPQAEYAAFYANKAQQPKRGETYTLLLCAVCVANVYPVSRLVDYAKGADISKFHYDHGDHGTAKALKGGFDAHFVAVRMSENYQASSDIDGADFDELVVGNEEQVLPFAKLLVKVR